MTTKAPPSTTGRGLSTPQLIVNNSDANIVKKNDGQHLQDEKALERFSTLVGKADLVEVSSQLDTANTATTHSVSLTERDVLRPEEIRLIPDGQALVIYRNSPAMIVDLIPWTRRPDGAEIAAGINRVRAARIGQPA